MQMLRTYSKYWIFFLAGLLVTKTDALATDGGGIVKAMAVLDGSLHQISVDSSRTVQDSAFFNPAYIGNLDTAYSVQNIVTVKINEASTVYLHNAFAVTVGLRIYYTIGSSTVDSIDRNFTVKYDSAGVYDGRNSFVFYGARKVTVKVLSVASNVTGWDPVKALMVENLLVTRPRFNFSCTNTVSNITVSSVADTADELPVSWTAILGADQYDLEWTYVDANVLAGGRYSVNPDSAFLNNATRATITGTGYRIPLMYDDSGTLFIRVRPVQLGAGNSVVAAGWSSESTTPVMGRYDFVGHQRAFNWQSNISFAEEGKRKVVVQYFDGSLRNRQTVTKDNTTNTTIVAETYYDYQGRPAIQVMPAPTLNNVIHYTAGFNVSINSAEYSQSNYDSLPGLSAFCDLHAEAMDSTTGASQYYSANNPSRTIGVNQFIPTAKAYPFTETEYTPDNTGRISRQGGVGPDHQLGSGHETKYYYGTPDQHELDALFGTEVGNYTHYFKNMVRDANGQYSVSYMDMHGRTIATALAGNAPPGMASLASNIEKDVTENLVDSASSSIQDLSMISQKSLLVTKADTFDFHYALTADDFCDSNCEKHQVCYTCLYDLEITITDNCNNQSLPDGKAWDTVVHNFSPGAFGTTHAMNFNFSKILSEGNYLITKKLTVNKDGYNYYLNNVYLPGNTCMNLKDYIDSMASVVRTSNGECAPDCETCRVKVGAWADFWASFRANAGISDADTAFYRTEAMTAYNNALTACDILCQDNNSEDNDIRKAMLQDMTPPYGQYADTLKDVHADRFSIFFQPASDTNYVSTYQLPGIVYKDDNGNPDKVYSQSSGIMVSPNQLTTEEFVQNFKPSWAEALLPYHPEYCKLKIFQAFPASIQWDKDFASVNDYATALDKGYLNPTNRVDTRSPYGYFNTTPAHPDPMMLERDKHALLYAIPLEMWNWLYTYEAGGQGTPPLSMWAVAVISVKCPTKDLACVLKYADAPNRALHPENINEMCVPDRDKAWQNFRDMYLNKKHDLVLKYLLEPSRGCIPSDHRQYGATPSAGELFAKKHQPQFTDTKTALDNTDQKALANVHDISSGDNAIAAAKNTAGDFYSLNVHAYENLWMQRLTTCKLYDTVDVRNTLIPRLYKMARQACDADHPFGASSLPAGLTDSTNPAFRDFKDIIDAYNAEKGISDALHCNGEIVTEPAPYDKQPAWAVKPVYSRPSDCECKLITDLNNLYQLTARDATFSDFLHRTQGVDMTEADLNTLLMACRNTTNSATCINFSHPIGLPPSMQCNVGTVCSDCSSIRTLYRSYLHDHAADTPAYSVDVDTTQAQKNLLFQNYMNNRLGYQLQAWQYLQFMDSCNAHTDTVGTGICVRTVADMFTTAQQDAVTDIRRTPDGGYVMVGSTATFGGKKDAYIIRYDSSNNIQWAKKYGGADDDFFTKVKVTADGGYVATGYAYTSFQQDTAYVLVVKIDPSGNTIWQRKFGFNSDGDRGFDIIQTSDRGYAIAGDNDLTRSNGGQEHSMIMKLDSNGNFSWAREFSPGLFNDGYGVTQVVDTLILTGRSFFGSGFVGSFYKLDRQSGSILNQFFYVDPSATNTRFSIGDVFPMPWGYRMQTFEAVSSDIVNNHLGLLDINHNGSVRGYTQVERPSGATSNRVAAAHLLLTKDSGFLAAQSVFGMPHIFWTRFNASSTVQWGRTTTLGGNQSIGATVQNLNGSFAALITNNSTATLLRLSDSATTGCYDSTVSMTLSSPTINYDPHPHGMGFITPSNIDSTIDGTNVMPTDNQITCNSGGNCYTVYNGPTLCGKAAPIFPPAVIPPITACTDSTFFSVSKGTALYNYYSDSLIGSFEMDYLKKCLQAYKKEVFTVTHSRSEYHYTLYYYDQAGNLMKTVPPAGVDLRDRDTWYDSVKVARAAKTVLRPAHTLETDYRYNTLNEVVSQKTPDAGISNFWYDRLGRLAISQNALQKVGNKYSYTKYDSIGRITQVGQLVSSTAITDAISRTEATLASWWDAGAGSADQITLTTYDSANYTAIPALGPRNLRNRVAWTALYNTRGDMVAVPGNHATATYYSYDILGNVDTLVQDFKIGTMASQLNRFKKIVYDYDLVSGKVNKVAYQPGQPDAFYHTYLYDAENRITHVQTSTDSINWDNDAFYSYYAHGPLARTILGEQQVQGINYAYTLQGWIKAINPDIYTGGSFTLRPDSSNNVVAATAYNVLLNYYNGDYAPVTAQPGPDNGVSTTLAGSSVYRPLFNGNISSMGVNVRKLDSAMLYNYQYDQLNRLVNMDAWRRTDAAWSAISATSSYRERVSYDPNGNILTYARNGKAATGLDMDKMKYNYKTGTNQLDYISDDVSHDAYPGDIDNQNEGNYKYDAIGQLTSDDSAGIGNITWTVYGKIASIVKSDKKLLFTYDASGNRINKSVVMGVDTTTTWYIRNAQGNVISVYTYGQSGVHSGHLTQTELDIYSANRLGVRRLSKDVYTPIVHNGVLMPSLGKGDSVIFDRGNKLFELTNHLGNVLITITDKRFGVTTDSIVRHFIPDVANANDYYSFGMLQPGRNYAGQGSTYRYGFNGKENDNEVKGIGDQIDYGMRVYDPRIGRFLSVDPLQKRFAYWTPYQFSANSPIVFVDMDGLEPQKNYLQWNHIYNWAKKDYYDDDFDNYFKVSEKDKYGQPYIVRTKTIGRYPYTLTKFQYYNSEQKDYFFFNPTGFEPDYIQNLQDLKLLGEFGKALEKISVFAALAWSPFGRDVLGFTNYSAAIDGHQYTSTYDRAQEISREAKVSDYQRDKVLTVAVADVQDKDGREFRLVSINSASQQDASINEAVKATLKPYEIAVPNIIGGDAHAEENLTEFSKRFGLTVKSIDVNRAFCASCSETRRRGGAATETKTSRKSGKQRIVKPDRIRRN